MFRTARVRRRLLGLGFALTVHAAMFAALILGRQEDAPMAELPAFDVVLTPPLRPDTQPPAARARGEAGPRRVLTGGRATPDSEGVVAAPDTDALFRAPFVQWPPPSWVRRTRCPEGRLTGAERLFCDEQRMARGEDLPFLPAGDREKQADFERVTAQREIMRRYREGAAFPGLRCSLGGDCPPAP